MDLTAIRFKSCLLDPDLVVTREHSDCLIVAVARVHHVDNVLVHILGVHLGGFKGCGRRDHACQRRRAGDPVFQEPGCCLILS